MLTPSGLIGSSSPRISATVRMSPPASGPLAIITGRGSNSVDKVAVVKPQIAAMLADEPAYAGLEAEEPEDNPGVLVIPAARLVAWARRRRSASRKPTSSTC